MKAKLLAFIFIYFSESGFFNGLRPIVCPKKGGRGRTYPAFRALQ